MKRTGRFAVTMLGAVTLGFAVNAARLRGQTAPAVIWHFDSLPGGSLDRAGSAGCAESTECPGPGGQRPHRLPVSRRGAPSPTFTDGSVSVKCKPVSGHVDRACGLVFRYQDENNYYLTRANALEDNVRFYYVKNGRRIQLANWSGRVTSGVWHELRVEFQGDHVEVYWDGTKRIDAHDPTFSGPGRVGVWTKADSYTVFDDLTARAGG